MSAGTFPSGYGCPKASLLCTCHAEATYYCEDYCSLTEGCESSYCKENGVCFGLYYDDANTCYQPGDVCFGIIVKPDGTLCYEGVDEGCEGEPYKCESDMTTESPTDAPTGGPTDAPTEAPTDAPTEAPTEGPTDAPTEAPTAAPTGAPTEAPTDAPTEAPTDAPIEAPTGAPTEAPTEASTEALTDAPTEAPTDAPTEAPTDVPQYSTILP
ncbi:hypothetical protein FOZ60_001621 [Perkinsus olseni]|uniref:Uncharacterized protein n=1 Tax=Perkinsus olseni TaxID=32597 RepID=A0A7J6P103_PEROL|nr:hypothetical protein FOZ60_001621 [Perkinsus olseni]